MRLSTGPELGRGERREERGGCPRTQRRRGLGAGVREGSGFQRAGGRERGRLCCSPGWRRPAVTWGHREVQTGRQGEHVEAAKEGGRKQGRRSQAHRGSCPEAPVAQSTADNSPAPSHSWGSVGQCGAVRVNAVCSPCQSLAWLGPQGSPHMSPPLLPNPRLPAPPGPTPTLKEQAPAPVSSLPAPPPFLPQPPTSQACSVVMKRDGE